MKRIIFILLISMITIGAFAQKSKAPHMIFKQTEHNFGTMNQGSDVSFDFVFKKSGRGLLAIQNVKSSCGCTTPEWTKEPTKRGVIKVKYDSNRLGSFHKTITVYSNAKNSPIILTIKGNIIKTE